MRVALPPAFVRILSLRGSRMKMRLHTFASLSVNSATSTQNHLYTCRDGLFHVLVRLQLFVYGQASSRLLRPLLIASHERTPRKDEIMHTLPSMPAQRSNLHHPGRCTRKT